MIKNRPSRSAVKMMLVIGGLVAATPARSEPPGLLCNGRPKQQSGKAGFLCNGRSTQTGKAGLLCNGRSKVKMQCNERSKRGGSSGFTCDGARPTQKPAGR
jgi:hypothetical protein